MCHTTDISQLRKQCAATVVVIALTRAASAAASTEKSELLPTAPHDICTVRAAHTAAATAAKTAATKAMHFKFAVCSKSRKLYVYTSTLSSLLCQREQPSVK
eukprot:11139-Heterococcus_DN1.PRE.2